MLRLTTAAPITGVSQTVNLRVLCEAAMQRRGPRTLQPAHGTAAGSTARLGMLSIPFQSTRRPSRHVRPRTGGYPPRCNLALCSRERTRRIVELSRMRWRRGTLTLYQRHASAAWNQCRDRRAGHVPEITPATVPRCPSARFRLLAELATVLGCWARAQRHRSRHLVSMPTQHQLQTPILSPPTPIRHRLWFRSRDQISSRDCLAII